MKVYLAADHAGFELKQTLIEFLTNSGHDIDDCGAYEFDKDDDYPEIVARAAKKLSEDALAGKDSRAIVIGASGQGEAIVANRLRGVRCALYYGPAGREQTDAGGKRLDILSSTRKHNDTNALSLGARFLTPDEAKEAVKRWLETPFSGEERHARRIRQID
ncbi:MAG: Ribose-5-phosphate isomerase B [Parcubacteria group bacterium GW2011_GWA2_51_10]|nr:MAG: Ribose-5-phosphate isomerase B [Parcubacteria group bacterium GW2011_GWA2_51_10]